MAERPRAPLCKDCRFFDLSGRCGAPQNSLGVDLVTGEIERSWITAKYCRKGGWLEARLRKSCGTAGRWFAPATPEAPSE